MPDTRTHIIYLCAIFLMLGFGILIGEGLYPAQIRQEAKTLAGLRVQVDAAMQDDKSTKDQMDKLEDTFDSLRPSLVHGKLTGKRVIVVQTGDSHDATGSAGTALNDAGAVVVTVTVNPSITGLSAEEKSKISQIEGTQAGSPAISTDGQAIGGRGGEEDPNAPVFQAVAAILVHGTANSQSNEALLENLETEGMITVDGDLSNPSNLFVFVGGQTDPPAEQDDADPAASLDVPLMERLSALSRNRATIVGCESSTASLSYMTDYQNEGIGTVDCIDQPVGQIALPYVLRGGKDKDDYGLKSTAKKVLPASVVGNSTS